MNIYLGGSKEAYMNVYEYVCVCSLYSWLSLAADVDNIATMWVSIALVMKNTMGCSLKASPKEQIALDSWAQWVS